MLSILMTARVNLQLPVCTAIAAGTTNFQASASVSLVMMSYGHVVVCARGTVSAQWRQESINENQKVFCLLHPLWQTKAGEYRLRVSQPLPRRVSPDLSRR